MQTRTILFILMLFFVTSLPLAAEDYVGFIYTVNGLPADFELIRNGKKLSFFPFKTLQTGDKIRVRKATNTLFKDKNNFITLRLGDESVTVKYTNLPYTVSKNYRSGNFSSVYRIMNSVADWFEKLYRYDVINKHSSRTWYKTFQLFIPLLEKSYYSRLIEGKRTLHLAWNDGKPPYRIYMYSKYLVGKIRISLDTPNEEVVLTSQMFKKGEYYKIWIRDALSRRTAIERFKVVDDKILSNTKPKIIRQSNLPEQTKQTLLAAWLVSQGKEWALEAYQHVAEIAPEYYPAFLVKQGLKDGIFPSKSPTIFPPKEFEPSLLTPYDKDDEDNDEEESQPTNENELLKLAEEDRKLGKYYQALEHYQQALPIIQQTGDKLQEATTLDDIGEMYHKTGQPQQAIKTYQSALNIYTKKKIDDKKSQEATTLLNLGNEFSELNQHKKALTYYKRSLALYQKAYHQEGEGFALVKMGDALYKLGKYQRALKHYRKALKIFNNISHWHGKGTAYLNLGKTYLGLKEYSKASEKYQDALLIYQEKLGHQHGEALAFCGMAQEHISTNPPEYKTASQLLRECLSILEKYFNTSGNLWLAQAQLAFVETQLQKYLDATHHYRQALDSIESLRAPLSSEKSKLLFIQDKYYVYDEFIQLLQSLHQKYPTQGYRYEMLEVFERKQGRIFFEEIGKSSAQQFGNLPSKTMHQEIEFETQLAKAREDLINKSADFTSTSSDDEIKKIDEEIRNLWMRLETLKRDQRDFQDKLRSQYIDYYTLRYPQPVHLADLQNRLLNKGEIMLIYSVMEKSTLLWVVGKGHFKMHVLPIGETALEKKVNDFLEFIYAMQDSVGTASSEKQIMEFVKIAKDDKKLHKFLKTSHRLYQNLLPVAVRKQLRGAKLVYVVPTGSLYNLPFEALVTAPIKKEDEKSHYLIQDHAFAYLSSASLFKVLRDVQYRKASASKSFKASQPLLAFGDPILPSCEEQKPQKRSDDTNDLLELRAHAYRDNADGCLERLPDTAEEVTEIAKLLNAPIDKALKLREQATRQMVFTLNQQGILDDYRHLVFATHAVVPDNIDDIIQPALILSHQQANDENAYLTMKDVFGLTLNANVVTLSACKTGRGKPIKGEGIRGLTHAFMYAGTPAIAVTLWEVESQSAKTLSTGIFKHLRQPQHTPKSPLKRGLKLPKNLAEALRQTKLAMLSGKGKAYESHPYFWAPFVIWGDGAVR